MAAWGGGGLERPEEYTDYTLHEPQCFHFTEKHFVNIKDARACRHNKAGYGVCGV